jgi:membrane protease YdiL (CAAX protease family)
MRTDDRPLRLGTVQWGLVDVAAVLAALLLTIVGKNAVLAIPALGLMPAAGRAAARALTLAVYYGVQLGVLVFLAGRHGSALRPAFGLGGKSAATAAAGSDARGTERPSAVGSAGLVVVLLFGVETVAIGYGLAAQAAGWRQPISLSSDVASVFGAGGLGLALSVLLVAVVAPVVEELAFRGLILPALGDRWGMWPAIVISAGLFAAYHVNAWLFLPMLVFGIALGWLTWTRRALWPAIALHVLYNGLAVTAAFLVPK